MRQTVIWVNQQWKLTEERNSNVSIMVKAKEGVRTLPQRWPGSSEVVGPGASSESRATSLGKSGPIGVRESMDLLHA